MTETKPIHPETTRLYAESPFTRKIRRIIDDLKVLETVAPIEDKADVLTLQLSLEELLRKHHG